MTLRLPEDLDRELDRLAVESHTSKSALVVEGARQLVERSRRPDQVFDLVVGVADGTVELEKSAEILAGHLRTNIPMKPLPDRRCQRRDAEAKLPAAVPIRADPPSRWGTSLRWLPSGTAA
ncbi:hypothetical protein SA2016_2231 [Sinomonas atrocyanea]|uniref:Uncharacterized protein n=1 Tax=Sinomonas atrocyanea TaxID=37927 RepID=A0A127A0E8_9MICC|nr:CopG family transcriptional regulator [Sinomonas atrocyanea]AMM32900.1 hypothetical protein SA2016_2231 [Sinomonas atrocyanea]